MKPYERTGTFTGTAGTAYTLEISPQYLINEITFLPTNNSGVVTIRAKQRRNTQFEVVQGGTVDFGAEEKTIVIGGTRGYALKELEFTTTETNAFTVYVDQFKPNSVPSV